MCLHPLPLHLLRAIQGISGVHVIGLGREESVRHVIEGAGLFPRPAPGPA